MPMPRVFLAGQFRHVCTKEEPWEDKPGPAALHPDMEDLGEGRLRCPHCGIEGVDGVKLKDLDE